MGRRLPDPQGDPQHPFRRGEPRTPPENGNGGNGGNGNGNGGNGNGNGAGGGNGGNGGNGGTSTPTVTPSTGITTAFLVDVAIDNYRGMTVAESAANLSRSEAVIEQARQHPNYYNVFNVVLQQEVAKKVGGAEVSE